LLLLWEGKKEGVEVRKERKREERREAVRNTIMVLIVVSGTTANLTKLQYIAQPHPLNKHTSTKSGPHPFTNQAHSFNNQPHPFNNQHTLLAISYVCVYLKILCKDICGRDTTYPAVMILKIKIKKNGRELEIIIFYAS